MLDAGMPILRSLGVVVENTKGHFKRVFTQIRETITKGSSMSEALDEHPRVFPDLDRMIIEVAETAGSLNASFSMLAEWHEFVHRMHRRILAGLAYPILVLHLGAVFAAVPQAVWAGFDVRTFIVAVIRTLLYFYVPATVILVRLLLRRRVPILRWPFDYLVLWVPILGQAIYQVSICRYAKAFAMMYNAGVPIAEVTARATKAAGNVVVEQQFAGSVESVRNGGLAWEGFSDRLPSEYIQLWQIGEESGELDRTVGKIAEISGDRADLYFTEFARWFPKIIYFAIMGYMAYKVLSLYSQIYGNLQIPGM